MPSIVRYFNRLHLLDVPPPGDLLTQINFHGFIIKKPAPLEKTRRWQVATRRSILINTQFIVTTRCAAPVIGQCA